MAPSPTDPGFEPGQWVTFKWDGRARHGRIEDVFPGCLYVEARFGKWPHCVFVARERAKLLKRPSRSEQAELDAELPYLLQSNPLLGEVDEIRFTKLLGNTLSLSKEERDRVIEQWESGLSVFQARELARVFEDESEEFGKLHCCEHEIIDGLVASSMQTWSRIVKERLRMRQRKSLFEAMVR